MRANHISPEKILFAFSFFCLNEIAFGEVRSEHFIIQRHNFVRFFTKDATM